MYRADPKNEIALSARVAAKNHWDETLYSSEMTVAPSARPIRNMMLKVDALSALAFINSG